MNLQTKLSEGASIYTIIVDDELSADNVDDFRAVLLGVNSIGATFIVDLSKAKTIDTSALGMILLLKGYVDILKGKVALKLPKNGTHADRSLKAASFHQIFETC